MATTEFNPFDEGNAAQAEAEKAALEAGEKIVAAQEEDRARVFEQRLLQYRVKIYLPM